MGHELSSHGYDENFLDYPENFNPGRLGPDIQKLNLGLKT